MPVYNERERVERAIAEVLETELPIEFELVVVYDGSTDGTTEILRGGNWDGRVRVFEHPQNLGKGAAVRTALGEANGEYAAIFDADLEYDPGDLGLLMPPLLDGRSNACFGIQPLRTESPLQLRHIVFLHLLNPAGGGAFFELSRRSLS